MSIQEFTSNDYIKLIIDNLNIKTENNITILDIEKSIMQIKKPIEFLAYIKANQGKDKYKGKTGYQILNLMIEDFKTEVIETINAKIESKAGKLIEKVKSCLKCFDLKAWEEGINKSEVLETMNFSLFRQDDEFIFTDEELNALNKIGSFKYWFEVDALGDIYKLQKELESNMRTKTVSLFFNPLKKEELPQIVQVKNDDALVLEKIKAHNEK